MVEPVLTNSIIQDNDGLSKGAGMTAYECHGYNDKRNFSTKS